MPTSLFSKVAQGTAVSASATVAAFFVWAKHCKFVDFDPATDPVFQSPFFKKYNPDSNPTTHDLCVRKIPIFKLKPELVEDAEKGGTKLVEAFCAGVWGGFGTECFLLLILLILFLIYFVISCSARDLPFVPFTFTRPRTSTKGTHNYSGYTPQRLYLQNKYRNNTTTAHQLWTKPSLLNSDYSPGTQITDHFEVLAKSPTSIVIRCGDSPLKSEVRPSDGLFEIGAKVNPDKGYAEFRLKSVFYQGLGKVEGNKQPMDGFMWWAHKQYTKLWMESAMRNVKR